MEKNLSKTKQNNELIKLEQTNQIGSCWVGFDFCLIELNWIELGRTGQNSLGSDLIGYECFGYKSLHRKGTSRNVLEVL
eukprot:scaffold232065_cov39-Prasinocladus_malaysianus.AAC.2